MQVHWNQGTLGVDRSTDCIRFVNPIYTWGTLCPPHYYSPQYFQTFLRPCNAGTNRQLLIYSWIYIYYCHCEMFWSDLKRLIEQCCIGICYIIMSVVEFPKFKVKHLNLAWRFAYIQQKHHRDVGIFIYIVRPTFPKTILRENSCCDASRSGFCLNLLLQ